MNGKISLRKFKSIVDEAVKRAGKTADHVGIEVWYKKRCYKIVSVGQFHIMPTMTMDIEPGLPE
jgi:hypothetical protein